MMLRFSHQNKKIKYTLRPLVPITREQLKEKHTRQQSHLVNFKKEKKTRPVHQLTIKILANIQVWRSAVIAPPNSHFVVLSRYFLRNIFKYENSLC